MFFNHTRPSRCIVKYDINGVLCCSVPSPHFANTCLTPPTSTQQQYEAVANANLNWGDQYHWPGKISDICTPVSLSLLHSHTCFIYEANMRYIWDKYEAFMMQISIFFSKNEVLNTTIFEYCQNIIKLWFLMFQYTVVKP